MPQVASATLFLSDLHLTPERPGAALSFRRFLDQKAIHAEALYLLGDLFEAWVGDDDLILPFHAEIASDLKRVSQSGVSIYFLPGNRDFLVGPDLARAAGLTLLEDPTRIDLYGTATLLAHGDAWCTDDAQYQALRAQIREPAWRADFLDKPLAERHAIAAALRERSELAKAGKRPEIMDVNPLAIAEAFRRHAVSRIIHGHTHRPARHSHHVDGKPCERWVLPDWYDLVGGYLVCDATGCRAATW
ncbi:MAG: UDP-2,3-diacylglucosamine diphosphatase [Gallionellaceae bacterium]|nr:UDP-2,3-diacylglucosamine diphosphatase [Gallionellaceae bacterium]